MFGIVNLCLYTFRGSELVTVCTMQFEIEENLLEEGSFEIVSLVSGCSGSQGFPIKDSRSVPDPFGSNLKSMKTERSLEVGDQSQMKLESF